ncbi:MAG: C25 family cysteine peptidase [Bacteroidales bacterium]
MKKSLFKSSSNWRPLLIIWVFTCFLTSTIHAIPQQIKYKSTLSEGFKCEKTRSNCLNISYKVSEFSFDTIMHKGKKIFSPKIGGLSLPNQAGAPDLPYITRRIAIPNGAIPKIKAQREASPVYYRNIDIAPAIDIPHENGDEKIKLRYDDKVYGRNAYFPKSNIQKSEIQTIRGIQTLLVQISPFQYNPANKELKFIPEINFQIEWSEGNTIYGDSRLKSRFFDPMLNKYILNSESLYNDSFSEETTGKRAEGAEYIIVIPNNDKFKKWADSLKLFRNQQGISTKVISLKEIEAKSDEDLINYLKDAYQNWYPAPSAILLMGDYNPDQKKGINSPVYNEYCISDLFYGDINGDGYAEMAVSRIPVQNEFELSNAVKKILKAERNPSLEKSYYQKPVLAMGWQTERWFQLCSEVVYGFFSNTLKKEPIRESAIYSGTPDDIWSNAVSTEKVIDFFGPDNLNYIPKDPKHLNDWDGSANRIVQDLNEGSFLIQHRDHGNVSIWGEPTFTTDDIKKLKNKNPFYVLSVNCLTGKFDAYKDCIAETFIKEKHGAFGVIAATQISYSFFNDIYIWGLYDYLWPEFIPNKKDPDYRKKLPCFANVAAKLFLQECNWISKDERQEATNYLFHSFGDAFSPIYTELPEPIIAEYNEAIIGFQDYFEIEVEKDAEICLSYNGEILGKETSKGEKLEIKIPEQTPGRLIDLVITKQNKLRLHKKLEVLMPGAPYCIYKAHTVIDNKEPQNQIDFNDSFQFNLKLKNVGEVDAQTLSLKLKEVEESEYFEIIDNQFEIDGIENGKEITIEKVFKVKTTANIPNKFVMNFCLEISDGTNTWENNFADTAYTPIFHFRKEIIDDSKSLIPNQHINKGETFVLKIPVENIGRSNAKETKISVACRNPLIHIEKTLFNLEKLNSKDIREIQIPIQISPKIANGSQMRLFFQIETAEYSFRKFIGLKIGNVVENWEDSDYIYEWSTEGDTPWTLDTEFPAEGKIHLRSGKIKDKEKSVFKVMGQTMGNDSIHFYRKVSSETDDNLIFYIDGIITGKWSGNNQSYTKESFPVSEGFHSFEWVYRKNSFGLNGGDCAWIDLLELPPLLKTTVFAGFDNNQCEKKEKEFDCKATATYYQNFKWETSGTGSFIDPSALETKYMASEKDVESGSVRLTAIVQGLNNKEHKDYIELSFGKPNDPILLEGNKNVDSHYNPTSAYYSSVYRNFEWEVIPENCGQIEYKNDSLLITWNPEFKGDVRIKAKAINYCGESEWGDYLNIEVINSTGIKECIASKIQVYPNPTSGKLYIQLKDDIELKLQEIVISNLHGNIVYKQCADADKLSTIELSTKNLNPGIHFIQLRGEEFTIWKKFVKR